jgi:hypothetical protein
MAQPTAIAQYATHGYGATHANEQHPIYINPNGVKQPFVSPK